MSSGVCKNKDEDKVSRIDSRNDGFKFWIYLAFIILGLLLILVIGLIIYSFMSSRKPVESEIKYAPIKNTNSQLDTNSIPTFTSKDISSYKQMPDVSSIVPSIPPPQNVKKPFLSSLMGKTSDLKDTATEQISLAYNRTIPVKKGGFRCFNRRRF